MNMQLKLSAGICALATGLGFAPAYAQQVDGQSPDDVDSNIIIVTAQKRAQNVQDVPIAISAITGDYLTSRDITSIDGLGAIAPNVKFERGPGSTTIAQIAIRGSVTINPAVTWEPAVGLYLDGVYIAKNQGAIFDVADLARIEVLRGPQGTLYGRNSLAGAVNLVTAKPSGEFGGKLELSYGNFDYKRAKAVLNLPALGPLSIKLSGQLTTRDGFYKIVSNPFPAAAPFVQPATSKDAQSLDSKSFMAQARLEASDNLTFDYSYDYNKNKQRPAPGQLLSVTPGGIFDPSSAAYIGIPLALYANPNRQDTLSLNADPFQEQSRTYGHALTATLDLGSAELKSITAYRDLHFVDSLELDGSPIDIATTTRDTNMNSFSQELQLTGSAVDSRLNYVLGAFYYREKAGTVNPQRFFGVFGPGASQFKSSYASNTTAYAAYAQADVAVTDALKLTLGARYTEESKNISRQLLVLGGPTPFVVADVKFGDLPKAKFNNFSPAATLAYQINPDVNVYARFAKGYKSGGFNGETNNFVAPTTSCPTGTPELCTPYRPEKVDSYELGIKNVLADGALVLNIAAFYDKHKDIQLSVFDATGAAASTVLNAAKATIKGIEVETVIRPSDSFTVNASFAYLDAKYDSFLDGGVDVSNNRAFPHTPKYSAAVGVDWRAAEGDWGRLNIVGDLNMVSKYYAFPYAFRPEAVPAQLAGNSQAPGRVTANMSITLSELNLGGTKARISGWVKNLTNENALTNFIDFGPGFGGLLLGYFNDPRTFGLTIGAEF